MRMSGKAFQKTLTGKSEKEVKTKMKAWQKEMARYGEEQKKNKNSFKNYVLKYYRVYKKDELSHNSYRCYMLALENHILPFLGEKKIIDVSKSDIQELFKTKRNYSKGTLRTIRIVFNSIFDAAIEDGFIRESPVRKVVPVSTHKTKHDDEKAMTQQQALYIKALEGERFKLVYLTLLYIGLRIGKCLALTWNDYRGDYLSINKTVGLVYIYDNDGNKYLKNEVGPTKNGVSRNVPLPEVLKKEFDSMQRDSCNLIFHSSSDNYLTQSSLFRSQIRICHKAGIPLFSLHELRHTYATRLLALNKPPKIVQKLLDHTNIATTMNIYTYVFDDIKMDAISDLKLL